MKLDPNAKCDNPADSRLWAVIHDAIAHPFMALTGYSRLSVAFHNWTSSKAWPRSRFAGFEPLYKFELTDPKSIDAEIDYLRDEGRAFVIDTIPGRPTRFTILTSIGRKQ